MNDDERLRRLLEDAVSDIEPEDGLGRIQARTKVTSMNTRRPWLMAAAAAAVATAATLTAVVVLGDGGTADDPGFAGPSPSPTRAAASPDSSDSAEPSPSDDPTPTGSAEPQTVTVPVYYPGETTRGPRLFREFHRVPAVEGDAVKTALAETVRASNDPDYGSYWPEGTSVTTLEAQPPDVITIDVQGGDLRRRPQGMSAAQAELSVQQLVYTAQAASQTRAPVQLMLNGERTDMLLGVPVSEPLAEGSPEEVLAQVWVIEPGEGAQVTSPFEVSGLAAAFEANVVWELRQGEKVVQKGFTTARACCAMEPYSFEVDAPPGEYTLVVQDSDPSGGEGFGPWQDTKTVTVVR